MKGCCMLDDSIEIVHKGREVCYSILSDIFLLPPAESTYEKAEVLTTFFDNVEISEGTVFYDGLQHLKEFLVKRNSMSVKEREELHNRMLLDYTRLYCVGSSVAVSESVYFSPAHLTMQEITGEVYYIYKSCGFDMKHDANEPSDHISYELMFMSFLSKGIAFNIGKGNITDAEKLIDIQKEFLDNHLMRLAEQFTKATIEVPESIEFYGPAAYTMLGFIKSDREFLG